MTVRHDLTDFGLDDFIELAIQRKFAIAEELEQFATHWRTAYDAGLPGFGDETTRDDWMGGLQAWRSLMVLLNVARRQNPDLAARLEA